MGNRRLANRLLFGAFCGSAALAAIPASGSPSSSGQPDSSDTLALIGVVRDFQPVPDHPDFNVTPSNGYGPYAHNLATLLDADGKPVFVGGGNRIKTEWRDAANHQIAWCLTPMPGDNPGKFGAIDDQAISSPETFQQWYRDVPGVNISTTWTMNMVKKTSGPDSGCYAFETNDFSPFYPIDGQGFGNGNDDHNFHFTFEISCTFTYDAAANQFVKFKGDDDAWLFVDGKLVMDHGGIAGSREYYVAMNRLGLVDGNEYSFKFFQAERHQPQSQFHFTTNIQLEQQVQSGIAVTTPFD